MSQKHHQRSRAQKLARRDMTGIGIVQVPKGTKFKHDIFGRQRIVHANPHVVGAKELERGKRCYMSAFHSGGAGEMRSVPTMCQDAKYYPF